MSDDEAFDLVEPFDIDDGSLNGLSPQTIFTMGVEWATWRNRIIGGCPKTDLCLTENAARIILMLERHGWFCEERHPRDWAKGWSQIWVGDRKI
jgi:hypothetical protein